jgi:hypothetical protein
VLTREWLDASIVLTIVIATVAVGYSLEYSAQTAAAASRARLRARSENAARSIAIWVARPSLYVTVLDASDRPLP